MVAKKPNPSPQPWKLQIDTQLNLFEEFEVGEDETQEIFIDDPETYMDDLEFEDEITEVKKDLESD